MAVYFLTAEGVPVIKIGHSVLPCTRLQGCSVWSPVKLHLAAVDKAGDHLTEMWLLRKFWPWRQHGEWFLATPELRAVVAATVRTGSVPDALYLPPDYPKRNWAAETPAGPNAYQLQQRYGLSLSDLRRITGISALPGGKYGIPLRHTLAVYEWLLDAGLVSDFWEFMRVKLTPETPISLVPAAA